MTSTSIVQCVINLIHNLHLNIKALRIEVAAATIDPSDFDPQVVHPPEALQAQGIGVPVSQPIRPRCLVVLLTLLAAPAHCFEDAENHERTIQRFRAQRNLPHTDTFSAEVWAPWPAICVHLSGRARDLSENRSERKTWIGHILRDMPLTRSSATRALQMTQIVRESSSTRTRYHNTTQPSRFFQFLVAFRAFWEGSGREATFKTVAKRHCTRCTQHPITLTRLRSIGRLSCSAGMDILGEPCFQGR